MLGTAGCLSYLYEKQLQLKQLFFPLLVKMQHSILLTAAASFLCRELEYDGNMQ